MVVDDDEPTAHLLAEHLKNFGYLVAGVCHSGEEANRSYESLNPDLILMDINLDGGVDGIETAIALQARRPVPIVFITAYNDEATLQRAMLANPYGYLIKPFELDDIRSAIEVTLNRFDTELDKPITPDGVGDGIGEPCSLDAVEALKKLPIFQEISPEVLKAYFASAVIRVCDGGEIIANEGQESSGGFLPISGRISIVKTKNAGKELIVALLAPGDILGMCYCWSGFKFAGSARCQIPSRVLWIPSDAWRSFLLNESAVAYQVMEQICARLQKAYTLASGLAHGRVEYRILNSILALLDSFGRPSMDSPQEGRIYITRRELADLTGTTPETANRITKQLERDGLLDLSKPGIIKVKDTRELKILAGRD